MNYDPAIAKLNRLANEWMERPMRGGPPTTPYEVGDTATVTIMERPTEAKLVRFDDGDDLNGRAIVVSVKGVEVVMYENVVVGATFADAIASCAYEIDEYVSEELNARADHASEQAAERGSQY